MKCHRKINMSEGNIVNDDNVGKILDSVLDAGEG